MRHRVVITGLGCISPLGNNVDTTWKNIIAGKSGGGPITHYDASKYKSQIAAEVKDFDPSEMFGRKEARHMDRYTQFAMAATLEAKQDGQLEITDENRDRIGIILGTGIGGIGSTHSQTNILLKKGPSRVNPFFIPMMLPDSAGGLIAIKLGVRGPNMAVITACASGTNALGEATEMVRSGRADVIFAGGTEAAIVPISMAGMSATTALTTRNDDPQGASRPFDKDRDGFLMGEGAAVLILEELEHAKGRGANILAEITGYGSTNDAFHISSPAENGAGAAKCMTLAVQDAGLETNDIDYINAHGTSTALNDLNETAAIKTTFGEQAYNIPVSSTKSMTGHMIGATGAIEALFGVKVLQEQIIPPTINYTTPDPACDLDYVPNKARQAEVTHLISNSFGFGGHNATIVISKYSNGS